MVCDKLLLRQYFAELLCNSEAVYFICFSNVTCVLNCGLYTNLSPKNIALQNPLAPCDRTSLETTLTDEEV